MNNSNNNINFINNNIDKNRSINYGQSIKYVI